MSRISLDADAVAEARKKAERGRSNNAVTIGVVRGTEALRIVYSIIRNDVLALYRTNPGLKW